ncbi:metallopeptidase family protein [Ruminococcaceae bacterium OttesenSCG-928-D13]|nr:metallopeptidase family protein [Ruminococcaceae bacterium OttesenSCG-928-D13]
MAEDKNKLIDFPEYENDRRVPWPPEIFRELNGGIVLLPDLVHSPHGGTLYTLGTYHNQPMGLGRYISIYYGSFVQVHGRASEEAQKQALREVLHHELTHHIESLAGVRDLEVKDEIFIENYRENNNK